MRLTRPRRRPARSRPSPAFSGRRYPISRYTRAATNQANPQKAIIDWIFKRTGLAEWHGDKIAVLSASPHRAPRL